MRGRTGVPEIQVGAQVVHTEVQPQVVRRGFGVRVPEGTTVVHAHLWRSRRDMPLGPSVQQAAEVVRLETPGARLRPPVAKDRHRDRLVPLSWKGRLWPTGACLKTSGAAA